MATETIQVSANVSKETKAALERYTRKFGVKKAFLIEQALLHHLQALMELSPDVIVPPGLLVTEASGRRLLDRLEESEPPTAAMNDLFSNAGG